VKTRLSEHAEGLSCLAIIYNKKNMATNYNNRDLDLIPDLTFTFAENYTKSNKSSPSQKSINKGFKYFSEGYIQDLKG
jgi:hypothetical protein